MTRSDTELLRAWQTGDARAGSELAERHYPLIERFFINKVDEDAAIDLIQHTFLGLVNARARIRSDTNFRSYLLGIARNVLYKYFRRYHRHAERLDYTKRSAADLQPTASSVIAREQELQLLHQALRRIPIESQMILELYYWESMRAREIAELLEVPEGTARTRIRRARQLLERELETLAQTPALLESTVSNLESWASRLQAQFTGRASAP